MESSVEIIEKAIGVIVGRRIEVPKRQWIISIEAKDLGSVVGFVHATVNDPKLGEWIEFKVLPLDSSKLPPPFKDFPPYEYKFEMDIRNWKYLEPVVPTWIRSQQNRRGGYHLQVAIEVPVRKHEAGFFYSEFVGRISGTLITSKATVGKKAIITRIDGERKGISWRFCDIPITDPLMTPTRKEGDKKTSSQGSCESLSSSNQSIATTVVEPEEESDEDDPDRPPRFVKNRIYHGIVVHLHKLENDPTAAHLGGHILIVHSERLGNVLIPIKRGESYPERGSWIEYCPKEWMEASFLKKSYRAKFLLTSWRWQISSSPCPWSIYSENRAAKNSDDIYDDIILELPVDVCFQALSSNPFAGRILGRANVKDMKVRALVIHSLSNWYIFKGKLKNIRLRYKGPSEDVYEGCTPLVQQYEDDPPLTNIPAEWLEANWPDPKTIVPRVQTPSLNFSTSIPPDPNFDANNNSNKRQPPFPNFWMKMKKPQKFFSPERRKAVNFKLDTPSPTNSGMSSSISSPITQPTSPPQFFLRPKVPTPEPAPAAEAERQRTMELEELLSTLCPHVFDILQDDAIGTVIQTQNPIAYQKLTTVVEKLGYTP